mgnify:CR=1 FL=1
MTVICPSCDARFRDPPEDVLLNRVLQCSRCEHEWSTSKAQKPRIKADAPTMAPDMKNLVDDEKAIKTALPVVMPKTDNEKQTQPIYVDREPETKTSKPFSLVWPATGMVCLMLLAGAVGLRTTIMNAVPQSVGLYQAAGLASDNPALEIGNVVTTRTNRDGIRQLIVRGEIENIADNTVPVPPLKLTMRGQQDANLFAWTVTAKKNSLKAGEKSRFTAVAHDFPSETVNVEVEFLPPKVLDKARILQSE